MDWRQNRQWAVKEIRKKGVSKDFDIATNRLIAKAGLFKRLDHPAFPRIVDIIDNDQAFYIVMDYVYGKPLDKILKEQGAQPEEKVTEWAVQICDAIGFLHSQKPNPIIYGDMQPANLMLMPDGNIKILGFGEVRRMNDHDSDVEILYAPGYFAPEQIDGRTDIRSDVYSIGVTMYHLLTGHSPCEPPYEVYPIRSWNSQLDPRLEKIIEKCTQSDPEERFQSCSELLTALQGGDIPPKKRGWVWRLIHKR